MKNTKQNLKKYIAALNLKEPYSLPKQPLSFVEPEIKPTEPTKAKKIAKTQVVKTTTGQIDHPSSPPVVKPTTGQKTQNVATFMIPHHIFEQINQLPLSKNEFKVLNCLLRFTLGFHRSSCEAGLSFVSKWTGIKDKNNVSKALKRLIEKKQIKKIKDYNCQKQTGTIYEVFLVKSFYKKTPPVKQPVVETPLGLKLPTTSGSSDHHPVVDLTPKKENSNKKINKTLSPEIESHFKNLTKRKQNSETLALEELLETFTPEQISQGFGYIQKHGDLSKGAPIHSAFRYLAITLGDVLKKIEKEKAKTTKQKVIDINHEAEEIKLEKTAEEALTAKRQAFFKEFPSKATQEKIIAEIIKKIPFKVPEQFAENTAITKWHDQKNLNEIKEKAV